MHQGQRAERPSEPEIVLQFQAVSRDFNGVTVVRSVSFELHAAEVLTLLGSSGCGKTTTLRMAIGLERCSGGRLCYAGKVVDAPAEGVFVPPEERGMGMVFQSYAIWPHMTVFENVAFPLRARGVRAGEIASRVAEVLELVELAGLENRGGMQLSGGQQQRVAIARALVFHPRVLLMDEPFSNLDTRLRDQMRADVRLLQQRLGLSILFVTHDQAEALALSDRVAVMHGGRIEQIGAPSEIYSQPATPFVRDFIGRWVTLSGVLNGATPEGGSHITLSDGTGITCSRPPSGLSPGRVRLTVRPESIQVHRSTEVRTPRAANLIRGELRALLFMGDHQEAVLDLASGERATLRLPPHEGWSVGERLVLNLPPDAVLLWPHESGQ